jgi:mono/diheme cytochrome c family protein
MFRRLVGLMSVVFVVAVVAVAAGADRMPAPQGNGWTLPDDAKTTKNPLTVDAKLIEAGKALFKQNCQRCHGPGGLGDGPDGDPDAQDDMNLTVADRAANNPDGVVFYKAWNGRKKPKMPAFKEKLTKDQVWTIVSYVQTLRKTS